MCRSQFGKQHGDFCLDVISLAAVRNPFSSLHGGRSWWLWLYSLVAGAWYRLTGQSRGDGALRLPE